MTKQRIELEDGIVIEVGIPGAQISDSAGTPTTSDRPDAAVSINLSLDDAGNLQVTASESGAGVNFEVKLDA